MLPLWRFSPRWMRCCSKRPTWLSSPARASGAIDARFAAFQTTGFALRQLVRLHALVDALLLVDVALDIGLHALR